MPGASGLLHPSFGNSTTTFIHECHGADLVGLHVGISNKVAVRLYCTKGCGVVDIMPLYYSDGE